MPRARNNQSENESDVEQAEVWKTKTHSDGNLKPPKRLREKLVIKGHQEYHITVV